MDTNENYREILILSVHSIRGCIDLFLQVANIDTSLFNLSTKLQSWTESTRQMGNTSQFLKTTSDWKVLREIYLGALTLSMSCMPDMTSTLLVTAVTPCTGKVIKIGLSVFVRGENLLQKGILHFCV